MSQVVEVIQDALQISDAFLGGFMYSEISVCVILTERDLNPHRVIPPLTLCSDKWTQPSGRKHRFLA